MKSQLLLFIHGLGGNPASTWGAFPELVSADAKLESRVDLGFFEYPTSVFPILFFRKLPRIQALARALRTQIENAFKDYESIILVCHSLGGLIARRYLI